MNKYTPTVAHRTTALSARMPAQRWWTHAALALYAALATEALLAGGVGRSERLPVAIAQSLVLTQLGAHWAALACHRHGARTRQRGAGHLVARHCTLLQGNRRTGTRHSDSIIGARFARCWTSVGGGT